MIKLQSTRSGSLRSSILLPTVTFVLSAFIILLTLFEGQRRGLDYHYSSVVDGEQSAITIAISDLIHGLNLGYVGFSAVKAKLVENWPPGVSGERVEAELDHDPIRARQNAAIQAAASLPAPTRAYFTDRSLMTMVYDDIGYVDLVKLSFRLFGMKMEAMHYTYFVLLSLSALAFLLVFRADAVAQTVLLCTLLGFYIEIQIGHFKITPTFTGLRHGSTLSLIPMWHFAFLLVRRRRLNFSVTSLGRRGIPLPRMEWQSLVTLAATVAQLPILFLAIRMRGSAIWAVLFIIALAALIYVVPFVRRRLWTLPVPSAIRKVMPWPVVILLGGMVANNLSTQASLHPIYFTDDVMPYHGMWHSAVLGLMYSPELAPKRSAESFARYAYDQGGFFAAEDYLDRIRFMERPVDAGTINPTYLSPWTGTLKARLHDNIARRVFFEIVAEHPFGMLVLYLYKKPLGIAKNTLEQMAMAPDLFWFVLILLGGAVTAAIWLLFDVADPRAVREVVLLTAAPIPFSVLPNIWAYGGVQGLMDYYLVLMLFTQIVIATLIVVVVRQTSRLRQRQRARLSRQHLA